MQATRRYFIVMGRRSQGFALQRDRDYFAKPVEVHLSHSWLATRMLYVTDRRRGDTYPTTGEYLVEAVGTTQRGHLIQAWTRRHANGDCHARIHGHGWCRFSNKLCAILIPGEGWCTY